ncbi:hypothetical protein TSUD_159440 [Trifolium subterraneum]|uniref:Uncharacterized protein n=1 Tax=Trifolium subterraneum TaxID=3900 RepID=A0A2Z6MUM9_TRISU|nr:hypothetical protein TSUD_159440 [Trifolium subterraneum]
MSNGIAPAGIKQEKKSSNMQFEVNLNGCMTDCKFYLPDATTTDNTALSFRVAYHFAKNSKNNKEISACVGSMLCSVVPGFKNSVVEALNWIGITPCFVSLPSQAHENNIVVSEIPSLDCPSILVIFGYFLILILKPPTDSYTCHNSNLPDYILDLKVHVRNFGEELEISNSFCCGLSCGRFNDEQ